MVYVHFKKLGLLNLFQNKFHPLTSFFYTSFWTVGPNLHQFILDGPFSCRRFHHSTSFHSLIQGLALHHILWHEQKSRLVFKTLVESETYSEMLYIVNVKTLNTKEYCSLHGIFILRTTCFLQPRMVIIRRKCIKGQWLIYKILNSFERDPCLTVVLYTFSPNDYPYGSKRVAFLYKKTNIVFCNKNSGIDSSTHWYLIFKTKRGFLC
jgi:hypothetical protein